MSKTLKLRKAPASSANNFSVGDKKKGNDGNMWKIVQNKNGTKRWMKISKGNLKTKKNIISNDETNDKVLFVFYTFDNTDSWSYPELPKGWQWVGSGTTSALGRKKLKYTHEEQFMGPEKTLKQMYNFLNHYFKNLKNNKTIKLYKIESSYSP